MSAHTFCAWCQAERHEKPAPGQSHGICPHHYQQMLRGQGIPEAQITASLARLGCAASVSQRETDHQLQPT